MAFDCFKFDSNWVGPCRVQPQCSPSTHIPNGATPPALFLPPFSENEHTPTSAMKLLHNPADNAHLQLTSGTLSIPLGTRNFKVGG